MPAPRHRRPLGGGSHGRRPPALACPGSGHTPGLHTATKAEREQAQPRARPGLANLRSWQQVPAAQPRGQPLPRPPTLWHRGHTLSLFPPQRLPTGVQRGPAPHLEVKHTAGHQRCEQEGGLCRQRGQGSRQAGWGHGTVPVPEARQPVPTDTPGHAPGRPAPLPPPAAAACATFASCRHAWNGASRARHSAAQPRATEHAQTAAGMP